ncbi:MAG: hypothetical protein ABEL76_06365 [Bradymonadaceae bacterium]
MNATSESTASTPVGRLLVVSILWLAAASVPACDCGDSTESPEDTSVVEGEPERAEAKQTSEEPDRKKRGQEGWKERVEEQMRAPAKKKKKAGPPKRKCTFFPDNCPEGEACFSTGDGSWKCASFNEEKAPGDPCEAANDCNAGQQCIGGPTGTCLPMCNIRGDGVCPPGRTCRPAYDENGVQLPFGVCREEGDQCRPWPNDDCGPGRSCVGTGVGYRCVKVDPLAAPGNPCPAGPSDCAPGQACVRVQGRDRSRCRVKCDEDHPCERGRCQPLGGRPYGYCLPGSVGPDAGPRQK